MSPRGVLTYLAAALAVAVVALPIAAEQAVERASFDERLGTLPVHVSLTHNGRSTLATGLLGNVYYAATGPLGFGILARVTGPPEAGGTLASYVDPAFIKANLDFVHDPSQVVGAYGREFRDQVVSDALVWSLVVGVVGGAVVLLVVRRMRRPASRRTRVVVTGAVFVACLAGSTGLAGWRLDRWGDSPADSYPLPGLPQISFGSPQTLELARQVKPFIEKNAARIEEESRAYEAAASSSFASALADRSDDLAPRDGETIVIAEADPQGGYVGATVRAGLLTQLQAALAEGSFSFRTISGDVTSNGTVAEADFVRKEAAVGDGLPVIAVAGDHDSTTTVSQLRDEGVTVPDLNTVGVDGLLISGANDVQHKALFGALVSNPSGETEQELGAQLRKQVPTDEAGIVLLHQPKAAAGYLGVPLDQVRDAHSPLTTPVDDGIPDVPPGTVSIGHLHDLDGPWVVWNTDGDLVTWTVVDQLGTSGGMEERPTFNRFSTPLSPPLKTLSFRLQYVDTGTGLQTGYATVACDVDGACAISRRTDVGLPVTDPRVTG